MDKELKISLLKFNSVFKEIRNQLTIQTKILTTLYNLNVEKFEDDKREAALRDVEKIQQSSNPAPVKSEDKKNDKSSDENNEKGINSLITGLGVWLGSALSKGAIVGTGVLFTSAFISTIAGPVESFVSGMIQQGLKDVLPENMQLPDGTAKILGDTLSDAGFWAIAARWAGGLLGKRLGMIIGVSGFLYTQISKYLTPENSEIVKSFEDEFGKGSFTLIGTGIGTVIATFLPGLIFKGLTKLFTKAAFTSLIVEGIATTGAAAAGGASLLKNAGKSILKFGKAAGAAGLTGAKNAAKAVGGEIAGIGAGTIGLAAGALLATTNAAGGNDTVSGMMETSYKRNLFKLTDINSKDTPKQKIDSIMKDIHDSRLKFDDNTVDIYHANIPKGIDKREFWEKLFDKLNYKPKIDMKGLTTDTYDSSVGKPYYNSEGSLLRPLPDWLNPTKSPIKANPRTDYEYMAKASKIENDRSRKTEGAILSLPNIMRQGDNIKHGDNTVINNTTINAIPEHTLRGQYLMQ